MAEVSRVVELEDEEVLQFIERHSQAIIFSLACGSLKYGPAREISHYITP
jgi:hypothetical protein